MLSALSKILEFRRGFGPVHEPAIYPRWHLGWQDLYDLGADPAETDNLAAQLPELADEMRAELEALGADVDVDDDDDARKEPSDEAARL